MIDMLPLLQAHGITFIKIKNESLDRYASELISQRQKDSSYTHVTYQID